MFLNEYASVLNGPPGLNAAGDQTEFDKVKQQYVDHRSNYSTWTNDEKQMWEPMISNVIKYLYQDNLSRNPTQQELDYWIPVFANAGFLNDSTFSNPVYQTWKDTVAPEKQVQAQVAAKKQIADTLYTVVAETQRLDQVTQTAKAAADAAQEAAAQAAAAQTAAAAQLAADAQAAASQAAAALTAQQAVVVAATKEAAKINPAIQTAVTQNATSYQDIVKIVDQTATKKDVAPIIATQPKTQVDVLLKPSPTETATSTTRIAPLVMISALAFLLGKI